MKQHRITSDIDSKRAGMTMWDYIRMPENNILSFRGIIDDDIICDELLRFWIEIEAKYTGYITKELSRINRLERMMTNTISDSIDYDAIGALTEETKEKLRRFRPSNIREASEIKGISIAHIMALASYLKKL